MRLRAHLTSGMTAFEENAETGKREAFGEVQIQRHGETISRAFLHLALRPDGTPELSILVSAADEVDEQLGYVATKEMILYGPVAVGLLELAERARALLRDPALGGDVLDVDLA